MNYSIDSIDNLLEQLAGDGVATDVLLGLRRDVLAGDPVASSRLTRLADQYGLLAVLDSDAS